MTVIPIMIGALVTVSGNAKDAYYGMLGLPDIFGSAQLSAILGTAHILLTVLCLSCGIAAETRLRIPRKRPGEDHTIIMVDLEAPVKPE